jgi:hypothetical protein
MTTWAFGGGKRRRHARNKIGLWVSRVQYIFDGQRWLDVESEQGLPMAAVEPWLAIQVHDSDYASVRYAPAGTGSGAAYLGLTPRVYIEDDDASPPSDAEREAEAIATWVSSTPLSVPGTREQLSSVVRAFLAEDDDPEPADDAEPDDADVFAENKARLFLQALELPVPDDLKQ